MKDHQRTGRTLVAGAVIGLMAFSNGNAGTEREAGIVIDGDRVTVFDQGKKIKIIGGDDGVKIYEGGKLIAQNTSEEHTLGIEIDMAVEEALRVAEAEMKRVRREMKDTKGRMKIRTETKVTGLILPDVDGDEDGTMTRQEAQAALDKKFSALDLNDDGVLNREELQAGFMKRMQAMSSDWNDDNEKTSKEVIILKRKERELEKNTK